MSSVSDRVQIAFRAFMPEDAAALAAVYRDAVRGTGSTAYGASQVKTWAAFADERGFPAGLARGICIVATCNDVIVGFGQLQPEDHVHLLYVASAWGRCGIGSALLARLEVEAGRRGAVRLGVNASRLARAVFERAGWQIDEIEFVERDGVSFERFRMSRQLGSVA